MTSTLKPTVEGGGKGCKKPPGAAGGGVLQCLSTVLQVPGPWAPHACAKFSDVAESVITADTAAVTTAPLRCLPSNADDKPFTTGIPPSPPGALTDYRQLHRFLLSPSPTATVEEGVYGMNTASNDKNSNLHASSSSGSSSTRPAAIAADFSLHSTNTSSSGSTGRGSTSSRPEVDARDLCTTLKTSQGSPGSSQVSLLPSPVGSPVRTSTPTRFAGTFAARDNHNQVSQHSRNTSSALSANMTTTGSSSSPVETLEDHRHHHDATTTNNTTHQQRDQTVGAADNHSNSSSNSPRSSPIPNVQHHHQSPSIIPWKKRSLRHNFHSIEDLVRPGVGDSNNYRSHNNNSAPPPPPTVDISAAHAALLAAQHPARSVPTILPHHPNHHRHHPYHHHHHHHERLHQEELSFAMPPHGVNNKAILPGSSPRLPPAPTAARNFPHREEHRPIPGGSTPPGRSFTSCPNADKGASDEDDIVDVVEDTVDDTRLSPTSHHQPCSTSDPHPSQTPPDSSTASPTTIPSSSPSGALPGDAAYSRSSPGGPIAIAPTSASSSSTSSASSGANSGSADPETADPNRLRKGRTIYKAQQVYILEQVFSRTHYPDPEVIETLSRELDISENKIKVWFQNKRARWRRRAAETGLPPQPVGFTLTGAPGLPGASWPHPASLPAGVLMPQPLYTASMPYGGAQMGGPGRGGSGALIPPVGHFPGLNAPPLYLSFDSSMLQAASKGLSPPSLLPYSGQCPMSVLPTHAWAEGSKLPGT